MRRTGKLTLLVAVLPVFATTVAQAGVVFRDKFDAYVNDAEMDVVWPTWAGTPKGTLDTAIFFSAPQSLSHPGGGGNGAARYHVFADAGSALAPTDADPVLYKFMFHDAAAAGNTRKTGTLLTSSNWSAATDKWVEFGVYGLLSQTQYSIRTVNLGGPGGNGQGWLVYPNVNRSVGWHTMRMEVGATWIKFKLDENPVFQITVNAASAAFTTIACGGPSHLASADAANYDDVHVSLLSDEFAVPGCGDVPPVTIDETLVVGATTVNVSNVRSDATEVKVYKSSTGAEPWTEIGSSTATPFASDVAVTVTPLVAGDTILATQSLVVTLSGFPPELLESCKIPQLNRIVGYCGQIPTPSVVGLTDAGRTTTLVKGVDPTATAVKVYAYNPTADTTTLIGTNNAPAGETKVNVTVTPLVVGNLLRATQTVLGIESCLATTGGKSVGEAGIIEDFEGTVTIANHPTPGVSGAWYDVSYQSYTDVLGPGHARATLFGSRCLNITDHGWLNGAYVLYEEIIPVTGEYHISLDMLIDEFDGSDYDFYNQYQVGVIVNGVHRDATSGIVPDIGTPMGSYPCLSPQRDGLIETEPVKVYVSTFTANAGDSILLAFSTTLSGYTRSKTATPASYVGMKVDNIKLIEGPKPPNCLDVLPVEILPTIPNPLEAGRTSVEVRNVDPNASLVRVFAGETEIGTIVPNGSTQVTITVSELVAGTTLTAIQTVGGIESCQCPGAVGPMVGEGRNSGLQLALGIRETGPGGGSTGPIEWVGATSKGTDGQPIGRELPTSPEWQTVTFAWASAGGSDPVTGFTGNSVVDGTHGVLESLNFTIDSENTGRYVIYIDSITNGETTIADFETEAPGTLNVFRRPTNSGSTQPNLLLYPDIAEVDGSKAADGSQSYRVEFQFVDNHIKRWLRLTTIGGDPVLPGANPLIDLSQPVTVKLLLFGQPPCGAVFADADDDLDVDMTDFAAFQRCINVGGGAYAPDCSCFDYDFNGIIDLNDLTAFNNCASGPNVPATPGCGD